mgnify:CR=1 FL=1
MKKSLIALAVLAASGASFAQSTVTMFGIVDAAVSVAKGDAGDKTSMINSGYNSSRFGVRGVEDLGGGLKASFDYTLETGAQRGTVVSRADSGVALSGAIGAVAVRNTRSSDLIASIGSAAISLPDGLYDSTGIVSRAAIDTVSYTTPAMNGFTGSFTFVENNEGNIAAATTNKSANVIGVAYANGPLTVGAAMKSVNTPAATTKSSNYELMAAYDLGVAKISYAFDGKSATTGTYADDAQGFSVTVPVGAISLGANYFKRGSNKVSEVGATYAFSKRTTLSASSGKQTADANGNQTRIRLAHAF